MEKQEALKLKKMVKAAKDHRRKMAITNKVIAEFMGDKFRTSPNVMENLKGLRIKYPHKWTNYLMFDYQWNWLMPVVEKIENLEYLNRMGRFNVNAINFEENYTCVIKDNEQPFIQVEGEDKRTATYNAVIDFIEWYNENKED